jgi:hypothetical protein
MQDWAGWIATIIFAGSYFCKEPVKLRWIQALAAMFWLIYGILLHAVPVIVANVIVAVAALYSSFQLAQAKRTAPKH